MNKRLVYCLVIVLAFAHQDFWLWDNPKLVFGFLPVGLAYHIVFSILVAICGALVVRYAWPDELQSFADADEENPPS